MATARRTTAKPKSSTTTKKSKTARWIRNTRNCTVHLRLRDTNDARYFIELAPRGEWGDTHRVPAALTDDHSLFISLNQGIIEVISQTEANNIDYGPQGYQGGNGVEITRPDDTTVVTQPDWDGKGRSPQRGIITQDNVTRSVQPQPAPSMQSVSGADAKMKVVKEERRATAEDMIPANVDTRTRKVKVERVRS